MRILIAIGVGLIVVSCGSVQEIPFIQDSNSKSELISSDVGKPAVSVKGIDAGLEEVVAQIHSLKYKGSLMLEFEEDQGLQIQNNRLISKNKQNGALGAINEILAEDTGLRVTGALDDEDLEQLRNRTEQIEKLSGEKLADLSKYISVEVSDREKAEKILRRVWKEKGLVKVWAKVELIPTSVEVAARGQDFTPLQGYLDGPVPGTYGMNIREFWNRYENKGENGAYVMMEHGWNSDHEDAQIPWGIGFVGSHGTAMLGIVGGRHGNGGFDGIAPEARSMPNIEWGDPGIFPLGTVINFASAHCGPASNWADCMNGISQFGDIPMEASRFWFNVYKRATAAGYMIIQSAGNGYTDLDDRRNLFEDSPDWSRDENGNYREDSGGIVVAASTAGTLDKTPWSVCGGRVDLFAWGTDVVTASYPDGDNLDWRGDGYQNDADRPNEYYTNHFAGTSPASAIIAGVATLLQSHAKSRMGAHKFLTSKKIRELLVRSGIPAENDGGCPIGVLPNMVRAAELFDEFWDDLTRRYPTLLQQRPLAGEERRRLYQEEGVGMECKLYDINYENSDPQCPERAQCRGGLFDGNEISVAELAERHNSSRDFFVDVEGSDYDCIAGAIWPSGLIRGKLLDFDADGRSDLVNNTNETIQIDLSSRDDFGAWDLDLNFPDFDSATVWPVMEDYDGDGRVDIGMFDKKTGRLFIKYTDRNLLGYPPLPQREEQGGGEGEIIRWDRVIEYPFRDDPSRDIFEYVYVRPVFGDYNGDNYVDAAFALEGRVEIDYGGPRHNGLGAVDEPRRLQYLTEEQMRAAPDWAYLVTHPGLNYKIPDGVWGAGEVWRLNVTDASRRRRGNVLLGGNEVIPINNFFDQEIGLKNMSGIWGSYVGGGIQPVVWPEPNGIFGGLDCHPLVADFDGDGEGDRSVQCPEEFRIVMSDTGELVRYPLGYDTTKFSLPGRSYAGGISYQTVLRLIDYQLNSSNGFPVIPVDMAGPGICAIPWGDDRPAECR